MIFIYSFLLFIYYLHFILSLYFIYCHLQLIIFYLYYSLLANGDSVRTTQNFFRVGRSTAYKIVEEVATVIWEELSPWYLRPRTQREWKVIASGFRAKWDFPNVIGAMDGKEFRIQPPPHSGSLYYNYKKFHSFKMLATCDAFCRFTWVDVGDFGKKKHIIYSTFIFYYENCL